jgi:uncharacterized protein with gpF-like domain
MELMKRLGKIAQSASSLVSHAESSHAFVAAPLRKLGLSKPFEPTAAAVKAYEAVIAHKVALIDRLPSKYRKDTQEVIWKFVMKGYDAPGLARELHDRFGIVLDRAQQIARSQCKMARAVMENADRMETGIREAVWRHDAAQCALPSHRAFNGRRYLLAQGASLDGKSVWPGSELQCFCSSIPIDPSADAN